MPKKILLVDDEIGTLKVVDFRLKKQGYDVDLAIDGEQALNMVKGNEYGLVLLDLSIPKVHGKDVCKIIKTEYNDIFVILLTATFADRNFAEIEISYRNSNFDDEIKDVLIDDQTW